MNKFWYTILFLAQIALFAIQLPLTIIAAYLLCVFYVLYCANRIFVTWRCLTLGILGFAAALIATLTFNHEITPILYLILTPFLFLVAFDFVDKDLNLVVEVLSNIFWIAVFAITFALIFNRHEAEPLGSILPWSSTNGIPSYLIVIQVAYSIAYYLSRNRLPIFSGLVSVVVAGFGLGRGAIIVALLIFAFSVLVNVFILKIKRDKRLFFYGIFALSISAFTIFDGLGGVVNLINKLIDGSKFSGGFFDEHRSRMIMEYLDKITAFGFLFGESYSGISIASDYGGNPHNSFIRIHSYYGILPLLFVMAPFLIILISKRCRQQKTIVVILLIFVLLRAATEPILFPTPLDFFYILYIMIFIRFSALGKNSIR